MSVEFNEIMVETWKKETLGYLAIFPHFSRRTCFLPSQAKKSITNMKSQPTWFGRLTIKEYISISIFISIFIYFCLFSYLYTW